MRRLGNRFYKTIVVLWLTLSIGSVVLAAISWWNLSNLMVQGRQLTATRDDLDGLLKSMLDTETGTRGYVITGNTNFLEPFQNATSSIPPQFDHLMSLVGGDPVLIKKATDLRGQMELSLNWQQQVIAARNRGFNKAADLVSTGQGKQVMDEIRDQISELDRMRTDKQSQIREQINRQVFRASLTSVGAGAAGVGAGIIAFWLSQIFLRQQKREHELMEAKLQAEHSNQE
jgi:CHASE3 domain sensor protein